jgi:hypothetical protein
MAKSSTVRGNQRWRGARPYNTRSQQQPLPPRKDASIPITQGTLTDRFARARRKAVQQGKIFSLDWGVKDEDKFFEARLRHMEIHVKKNISKHTIFD